MAYKKLDILKSQANIYYSDPIMGLYIYTDDIGLSINDESIFQALHNLLNTKKSERLMRYNLGLDLSTLLFERSNLLEDKIEEIAQLIEIYDDRIVVIDSVIDTMPQLNAFNITILFEDKITQQTKKFGILIFS